MRDGDGLYIALISIHGLIRAEAPELGRDPDTGGQILYVLDLARALARHPSVAQVDLLTRQVIDATVDPVYAEAEEPLTNNARIVRLPCGPRRYLRKESLWPHLDGYIDATLQHFRRTGRTPDIVHSHYADAGLVGSRLSQLLGTPLLHTGHSLGRIKRQRLIDNGAKPDQVETRYNLSRRIEAEEITLGNAVRVIASTRQEVAEQYAQYENYHPKRMVVIPPGVDLVRFHTNKLPEPRSPTIVRELERFLRHPKRPPILALSRPDERKNIGTLVTAFANHATLRDSANLIIIAGNRDDLDNLERGQQRVLRDLLYLIDKHDLYGCVAYPKHHTPDDVPALYRWAKSRRGLFVNPALTEPFGLTLIEAAASGLPIVATNDGGPTEIIHHCNNGLLIDPLDTEAMGEAMATALSDPKQWKRWSRNGLKGVHKRFTWEGHVESYLKEVKRITKPLHQRAHWQQRGRLTSVDRLLICDIDNTLIGDAKALGVLIARLKSANKQVAFGIATGRRLASAMNVLREWRVPVPDVMITAVGSEIHYGQRKIEDVGWAQHINYNWNPDQLREIVAELPGLRLQPNSEQRRFKVSFYIDPDKAPRLSEIRKILRQHDLHAKLIYSHEAYLDLLPLRASKGLAVQYLAMRWGLPSTALMVAGDSGNDEEMLTGNTLGVVVGNYSAELERLKGRPRILFAQGSHAWGILEAIDHYNFLGDIEIPEEPEPT